MQGTGGPRAESTTTDIPPTDTSQGSPTGGPVPRLEGYRVWVEPCPRRVRVSLASVVIADSRRVLYLFETGHRPVYYFPRADVRLDLLVPTDHRSHCPFKGEASYWSVAVGDAGDQTVARRQMVENAVWAYPEPLASCPDISGYLSFYWDKMDAWFEEDDEVFVHPRDPYARVDVMRSSRHIQVVMGGDVIADSHRPSLLFETGLPTRYYLPRADVRMDLLTPSATTSRCPYKGLARYWSMTVDGTVVDIAWSYPAPIPECPKIEALVCFFDERVDELIVDGVTQPRPATKWSARG